MKISRDANGDALQKIFILLRTQIGHDFSLYKLSIINRRIERRMAMQQITTLDEYVKLLQLTPIEVEALFRDLLIGVTNFFRDPEEFRLLEEEIIPNIFALKPEGETIRIWSCGCSTGEEAYSLAILLQEKMEDLDLKYNVQIFATDIDSRAIAAARIGLFTSSIAVDISAQRLERFFTLEKNGDAYRINKNIRDMLIFSVHDIIKDPPFSKLDLISCRNLMIYMGSQLQEKIIPLFHYALNSEGVLFLGTSENIGDMENLFRIIDRKSKFFQRKESINTLRKRVFSKCTPSSIQVYNDLTKNSNKSYDPAKVSLRQLTEQAILSQIAPSSALVNEQGDILYLHGRMGTYLELPSGENRTNNILRMARDGLRYDLTLALNKAVSTKEVVRQNSLQIKTNNHVQSINLSVCPLISNTETSEEAPLYLVMLEESHHLNIKPIESAIPDVVNSEFNLLKEKLHLAQEYLLSANEELQSSHEEFKSSKEELESINEELLISNTELETNVFDLSRSNNDMNNLLAGTGIGTIFVDFQLHILRFTPAASTIINLIPSDTGRPITHIATNLVGYERLIPDIESVLHTLIPKEITVQSSQGYWYTMRILPYRTLENVIEGVVLTFTDITDLKRTEAELKKAINELLRLAVVVKDSHDAIILQDLEGEILAWNPASQKAYGYSEAEALKMNIRAIIPEAIQEEAINRVKQLSNSEILEPFPTQRKTMDNKIVDVWITATALINENGDIYAISTTARLKKSNPNSYMEVKNGTSK